MWQPKISFPSRSRTTLPAGSQFSSSVITRATARTLRARTAVASAAESGEAAFILGTFPDFREARGQWMLQMSGELLSGRGDLPLVGCDGSARGPKRINEILGRHIARGPG